MNHRPPLLIAAFAALFASHSLLAQSSTAVLSGSVQDEQERTIASAKVTLLDPAKGQMRQASTDPGGAFEFSQLAPSTYELAVEQPGFAGARFNGVVINADDRLFLRITLKLAKRDEIITVVGDAPLIRLAPSVATAVDRGFIENQPLNGRGFQTLINLSPGVVITQTSLVEEGQFSVNGQRAGANYFTVDGVSANFGMPAATSPYEGSGGGVPSYTAGGGSSSLVSVDAVQEFTIQTSTYAAEFGRQPGAQVAIVTRSGTNEIHGSAFDYLRNDIFDANSWFGNANSIARPALRQNDFGLTLGGPAFIPKAYDGRNRTFFFVSYEGLRLRRPVISSLTRVPSLAARENATGIIKTILEAYPLPTGPALASAPDEAEFIAGYSDPSHLNATSVRIDHSLTPRISLFGRFNYAPSEVRERARYAGPSDIAILGAMTETATTGSTMLLSPSVTNDLRFNWSRSRASQVYVQDTFGGAKPLPRGFLLPSFADPDTSLLYLQGSSGTTQSPGTFSRNTQNQVNIVDTLSWTRGTHSLKFGVDYRHLSPSVGGRFFTNTFTFKSITQLATGIVTSGTTAQVSGYLYPRYQNMSVYAQDTWRMNPRLQLTYGLRWEVNPAPSGDANSLPLVVRGLDSPSTASLAPRGTRLYDTTYANFAPRVGMAYRVFRGRDTVIRGGFGVFYDLGHSYAGSALSPSNYPFTRSRTVYNVSITDPIFQTAVEEQGLTPPYPRLFSFYEDFKLPYTLQYSLAIEQPLGRANAVSISYVGAAGRRLSRVESMRSQVLQSADFTRIDAVGNAASSDYNSLQIQFKRRMMRGFQALLSYTWSKSLDTASDESSLNAPVSRLDPASDRGPSSFDIRHAFTGSASYEFPVPTSRRITRTIVGGFALDAVIRLRTAPPVNIVTNKDALDLGVTNVTRPDLVPGIPLYIYDDRLPGGKRINLAAFDGATPLAEGRQGNLGRNTLRGFGLSQVDLALRRRFGISERLNLDFRVEAFNVFNTPNFASPSGTMTSTNFGISTAILSSGIAGQSGQNPLFLVGGARSLQLALKLQF